MRDFNKGLCYLAGEQCSRGVVYYAAEVAS
jgi:hypothetical protein